MILDRGVRAIGIYRALFYLPSILGGSIAVAILWRQLFNYDGGDQFGAEADRHRRAVLGCRTRTIRCGR